MPHFLFQVAYTPEAWATMAKHPQDRVELVSAPIQAMGGKVETGYLCFGDYDLIVIADFPDAVTAAGFSMAASAGGAVKSLKTTPLLSPFEGIEAMRKAGSSSYQPPN
jgi:uncharacterized protein with GYD domain